MSEIKKFGIVVLVIVIIFGLLWYVNISVYKFNNADEKSSPAAKKGTLRIAVEANYYPFNYLDKNRNLTGFDVDIANALCNKMNYDCVFVVQKWDLLIPLLRGNQSDAIISSMSITDERKELVAFTKKYYQTSASFVARKGYSSNLSKENLAGKSIGVQQGTVYVAYAKKFYGDSAVIKVVNSERTVGDYLTTDLIELALGDTVYWHRWLQSERAFSFVGDPIYSSEFGEGVGIAVKQEDQALLQELNSAVDKIRADGTYRRIENKYFTYDIYGEETG